MAQLENLLQEKEAEIQNLRASKEAELEASEEKRAKDVADLEQKLSNLQLERGKSDETVTVEEGNDIKSQRQLDQTQTCENKRLQDEIKNLRKQMSSQYQLFASHMQVRQ